MKRELQKKLVEKYPQLYEGVNESPKKTAMAWGFEIGDGWYELVDELSEKITKLDPQAVALQVKEKFGTLRFYCISEVDEVQDVIDEYENKSGTICEVCGSTVEVETEGDGWILTLCASCRKKQEEGRNKL